MPTYKITATVEHGYKFEIEADSEEEASRQADLHLEDGAYREDSWVIGIEIDDIEEVEP